VNLTITLNVKINYRIKSSNL